AQATEDAFPLEVAEADVTVYAVYENTDVPFDKDNIAKIEFLKDPTKMEYTEGDPLEADGLQIKLTDKNGKEVTIGKDELAEYGVTLTPADGSNLTTDQNGKNLVASVGDKTANSPGTLKVNPKEKLATPTIDDLIEGATEITGTVPGGAGATVTVQTPEGEKTAKVGDDNKWTVTVGNPLEADQTVTVVAKEDGKLDSDPATQTVRAKDQTPTPTIDKPMEGATEITGTVPGGAGATVTVQTPEGEKTAKVGDDNKWTVTVDNPLEAGQKITAVATKDGEKPSAPATETVAAKPKTETPVINTPKEGDTTITGTAPKDSKVVVKTPEGEKTTTADKNGNWTVDVTNPLKTGDEITATAEEEGKKPSDPVKATVIDKEKTEQPTIVQPKEGDTTITGTAPKDSKVVVKTPEGDKTTTADENGNWTVDVTNPLKPGDEITATAEEEGKKPSDPVKATVIDKEKTEQPTIVQPKEGDTTITGTAPKDSEVVVKTPEGEKTTTADENGNWTVDVTNPLKPGDEITATAEEEGKKPSDPVKATVEDKPIVQEQTEKPTVNPVKPGDKDITGTAKPGASVVITTPSGKITTKADDKGNWKVTVDQPLKAGDKITAIAQEEGKTPSDPVQVIVKAQDLGTPGAASTGSSPKTGDTLNLVPYIAIIALAVIAFIVLRKMKNDRA
ncbi:Ig-like domain-containing protein, partial [Peptoniphilaceae bacterium SGI.137]